MIPTGFFSLEPNTAIILATTFGVIVGVRLIGWLDARYIKPKDDKCRECKSSKRRSRKVFDEDD